MRLKMNKKKYLIVIPHLDNIGGGQLYALRRAKYLKIKGFDVSFLTLRYNKEDVLIKEFEGFKKIISPYFDTIYSENDPILLEVVEKLNIKKEEIIYIESFSFFYAVELLAKQLEATHFIYMLSEMDINNYSQKDYMIKKLVKGEVIGVTKETLRISYGNLWKKEYENKYVNISYEKQEIISNKELETKFNLNDEKKIKILTVTRLEKSYVDNLIKTVIELSLYDITNKYKLIIVGDSYKKGRKEELLNRNKLPSNLEIEFLGYINPLFEELYTNAAIFVGMGTALLNAVENNCLSLGIDARNNQCSGFFGEELKTLSYLENDKTYNLLDKLIVGISLKQEEKKKIIEKAQKLVEEEFTFEKTMEKLDNYILKKQTENTYIEIIPTYKDKIRKILYKIRILNIIRQIRERIDKRKKFVNL